jgi:VWFA-related protein
MRATEISALRFGGIALLVMVLTPHVILAQNSQLTQNNSGGEFTIRTNVDLVVLNATVLNRRDETVSGLSINDFAVYEDGALQQIRHFSHEDVPLTAGILVDNSGSMEPKRKDVIAAAMAFARSSNPQDQMFVVNFNDNVYLGLPADTPFTDQPEQLQRSLAGIRAIGQTSLYDGILFGIDHLKQGSRDKKVLILITDGGDTFSKHTLAQVLTMARQSTATIYAIGIFDEQDGDQNPGVLKRLAKETGGEAFFPLSSTEITAICEGIARDIRAQYTLSYIPTITAPDGKYRSIQVKASLHGRGHLSVRTRTGYTVTPSPPSNLDEPARP